MTRNCEKIEIFSSWYQPFKRFKYAFQKFILIQLNTRQSFAGYANVLAQRSHKSIKNCQDEKRRESSFMHFQHEELRQWLKRTDCQRATLSLIPLKERNYNSQSEQTTTIWWTNEKSKQIHVASSKRGKRTWLGRVWLGHASDWPSRCPELFSTNHRADIRVYCYLPFFVELPHLRNFPPDVYPPVVLKKIEKKRAKFVNFTTQSNKVTVADTYKHWREALAWRPR